MESAHCVCKDHLRSSLDDSAHSRFESFENAIELLRMEALPRPARMSLKSRAYVCNSRARLLY